MSIPVSNYQLVQLTNGSWSVRSLAEGETFHPVVGPVAEAQSLYVEQLQLPARVAAAAENGSQEFVIWDVGLGAAANTLTVLRALHGIDRHRVRIVSFDHTATPLEFALGNADRLGYFGGYEAPVRALLDSGRVEFTHGSGVVTWEFVGGDFPTLLESEASKSLPAPDAILFDAYSPARNPVMWTLPVFRALRNRVDPSRPCALATYSRATLLRVTLLLAGWWVGAGSATGEKEETTLAASDRSLVGRPLDQSWIGRALRSRSAEPMMEPVYRQLPLSDETRAKLLAHPQFA